MKNTYQISHNYRIANLDDLNWAIQEGSIIENSKNAEMIGTIHWKTVSYHRDLSQACTRLAKMMTDESVCDTLDEYSTALQRHCNILAQAVGAIL